MQNVKKKSKLYPEAKSPRLTVLVKIIKYRTTERQTNTQTDIQKA